MKTKKLKLKLLKILGLRKPKTKGGKKFNKKFANCPSIHDHRKIGTSYYPENWEETLSWTCEDGTILKYNPLTNQEATDKALKKLKKETIKGNTLEDLN